MTAIIHILRWPIIIMGKIEKMKFLTFNKGKVRFLRIFTKIQTRFPYEETKLCTDHFNSKIIKTTPT